MRRGPYTPREYAYETAINALYVRFNNLASSDKDFKRALAKLHNRLLDRSGLDGVHLPTQ